MKTQVRSVVFCRAYGADLC